MVLVLSGKEVMRCWFASLLSPLESVHFCKHREVISETPALHHENTTTNQPLLFIYSGYKLKFQDINYNTFKGKVL